MRQKIQVPRREVCPGIGRGGERAGRAGIIGHLEDLRSHRPADAVDAEVTKIVAAVFSVISVEILHQIVRSHRGVKGDGRHLAVSEITRLVADILECKQCVLPRPSRIEIGLVESIDA